MIRHIFKIIWNEKRINGWITLELIMVFSVLWFCCDYLIYMGKNYLEPIGYDISGTYIINIDELPHELQTEDMKMKFSDYTDIIMPRLEQYSAIESVSLSNNSIPFTLGINRGSYIIESDSMWQYIRERQVTEGFFDVFKIKIEGGDLNSWKNALRDNQLFISPDRNGMFGAYPSPNYHIDDVKLIRNSYFMDEELYVKGKVGKLKDAYYSPYTANIFRFLQFNNRRRNASLLAVRVKPEAEKGFIENFKRDMKEQLRIGPFYFDGVTPMQEIKKQHELHSGVTLKMYGVGAIIAFLLINIFLGVIGTFWTRVQTRRSEMGLRLAIGSSKMEVKKLMISETVILLTVAAIVGTMVCLHLAQTDFLEVIDLPVADVVQGGLGKGHLLLNFIVTYSLLLLIALSAVWYPASQAASIEPAETLREE